MITKNLQALVLAAGKSKRCKTGRTKLLEKICGQEMILYPIKLLASMRIPTTVIVGHQQEAIKALIGQDYAQSVSFATQERQRGTADAVACSADQWTKDHLLIINGDIPLLTPALIKNLYRTHITSKATISFVTSHYDQPSEFYGRVITKNKKVNVVEAADF